MALIDKCMFKKNNSQSLNCQNQSRRLKNKIYKVDFIINVLRWIIGKIEKQTNVLHGTIFFKVLLKETSSFHVDLSTKAITVKIV